ncbi:MAG TPA: MBG domain-containing protein, partial [Anaerolineales bacterium]|nr:MBG domain-containing protein [Anaerolineales bacterium]
MKQRVLAGLSLALVLVMALGPAAAFAAAQSDQPDYAPGAVVTISGDNSDGAGYLPDETVTVDVTGPSDISLSCEAAVGADGAWSCAVTLPDSADAAGDYGYTAAGQSSGASQGGSFTVTAPPATEEPTQAPPTEEVTPEPTLPPAEEVTAEPTAAPTEEVTAEPTLPPTEEVTAEPTLPPTQEVTPEPASAIFAPYVVSNKADYAPGEKVVLSSANWQPGELVHIVVNDNVGASWIFSTDVSADAGGAFTTFFYLPNWFVAEYLVTAAGPISGTTTMTFTDSPPARVELAATGLASGCAANVSGTFTNPGDRENKTFSGATTQSVNTEPVTPVTFTYASSVTCGGTLYTLASVDRTSPITSGASGSDTTITAHYLGSSVADTTPPVISYVLAPSSPDGSNSWYKGSVTLTWTVSDPESSVAKTGCVDQNIASDQAATAYSCSATSAGGSSGPVSVSIQRDATAPGIIWVGGIAGGDSFAYGAVPAQPACAATDALSGPDTCVVSGYATSVGSHTLTAAATDLAGNSTTQTRSYTVTRASSTTVVSCPASVTYTGSALTPCTVAVTGAGGLNLTPDPVYANNTNAGTASASYTFAGDANHDGSSDSKTFTITKASATVTLSELTQTYTGGSLTPTAVTSPAGLTIFWTGAPHTAAGTYSVTATIDDPNYQGSASGTFTINKKAASVTPNAASKTYGDSDPALTGTLSGFLAADGVAATYSRTAGEIVGNYSISAVLSPAGVLSNYDISYNTADFTITKKAASVTPDAKSKTYG